MNNLTKFSKEKSFDDIMSILVNINTDMSVSSQISIYNQVMDKLQEIADTEYNRGYMDAVNVTSEISKN
jgi:hypothetical protein